MFGHVKLTSPVYASHESTKFYWLYLLEIFASKLVADTTHLKEGQKKQIGDRWLQLTAFLLRDNSANHYTVHTLFSWTKLRQGLCDPLRYMDHGV